MCCGWSRGFLASRCSGGERSGSEGITRAMWADYFFEYAVHQPLGLIEPATIWQVPINLAVFPGMKNLQLEHLAVPLG